ncbi:AAA family ATPase [Bradyrhizobium genosp. A]|uniref:AAA family ATPase n=1 Tax=Bradyrhizobium genosp. A TaxID=83626 RepID=UPI003CE73C49
MGLPGTGKTTLAKALAPRLNAVHFNADEVRANVNKDLGLAVSSEGTDEDHQGCGSSSNQRSGHRERGRGAGSRHCRGAAVASPVISRARRCRVVPHALRAVARADSCRLACEGMWRADWAAACDGRSTTLVLRFTARASNNGT